MAELLVVARLNKKSLIAADAVENTFVVGTPTTPAATTEMDEVVTLLTSFYNTGHTTLNPLSYYMSSSMNVNANANTFSFYDIGGHLDGSPHGGPIRVSTWSLAAVGSSNPGPDEVALCLSYHSAFGTDVEFGVGTRPRARDRGRIYFGPLDSQHAFSTAGTTNEPIPVAALLTQLAESGAHLRDDPTEFTWLQWSRKKAAVANVVGGWVDNAYDTQRRRGNKATARTAF